jgi:hypothetical protein
MGPRLRGDDEEGFSLASYRLKSTPRSRITSGAAASRDHSSNTPFKPRPHHCCHVNKPPEISHFPIIIATANCYQIKVLSY